MSLLASLPLSPSNTLKEMKLLLITIINHKNVKKNLLKWRVAYPYKCPSVDTYGDPESCPSVEVHGYTTPILL